MSLNNTAIYDLENLISERISIRIEKWNLYLGDAGLARKLAIECLSNLDKGSKDAALDGINSISVSVGSIGNKIPLSQLIISSHIKDLEEILEKFI